MCSIRCQRSLSGQRGVDAVGISASMEGGTEVDDSRPDVRIAKSPVFILRCHLRHRLQAQRFRDFNKIWSRFAECILLLPFLFFGSFAWRHCGDSFHVRGRARDFKQKPCEGGQGCDLDLAMVPFPEKPVRCFEDAHQKTICFAVLPDIVCVLG